MSIASDILETGALVTEDVHADWMRLLPMDMTVKGYMQEQADPFGRPVPQMHIATDTITHTMWIMRSWLSSVQLNAVVTVSFGNKNFRVKHVTDDPAYPDVGFSCTVI